MIRLRTATVLVAGAMLASAPPASAHGRKIIVDQDAGGPGSTDMQLILFFLQAFDV